MDCSLPGCSVHGIQASVLDWVAIPFFRGPSWPRDQTQVSCIAWTLLLPPSQYHPSVGCNFEFHIGKKVFHLNNKQTEKAMAPHSSTLAWKIPWTEEPGRLQSMGSLRVGHDWMTSLSLFTFMHWRRKWQPIPVFLPGESQGRGSLVGCRLWGRTESDTTEVT